MAKKRKHNKSRSGKRSRGQPPAEDRRAVAATVAWMMSVLATLIAELAGAVASLVLAWIGAGAEVAAGIRAVPDVMLLIALVTGAISLVLLPLVYRFRRTPPPPPVTVFSVVVALLPVAVLLLRTLRSEA